MSRAFYKSVVETYENLDIPLIIRVEEVFNEQKITVTSSEMSD